VQALPFMKQEVPKVTRNVSLGAQLRQLIEMSVEADCERRRGSAKQLLAEDRGPLRGRRGKPAERGHDIEAVGHRTPWESR
jgi:hypothetical protein